MFLTQCRNKYDEVYRHIPDIWLLFCVNYKPCDRHLSTFFPHICIYFFYFFQSQITLMDSPVFKAIQPEVSNYRNSTDT